LYNIYIVFIRHKKQVGIYVPTCSVDFKRLLLPPRRLFREQLDDVQDYLGGLFDVLERGELHLAVEIHAAGEDVRAWEAFEGKVCAICTATDRLDLRFDACHFHGFDRLFHDEIVWLHLLTHVVVLVLDLQSGSAFTVFDIDEIDTLSYKLLLLLELLPVVVADDVAEIGLLDGTLETDDVEEAVITFCQLRTLADRKQVIEFHADKDGVLHLVLRVARVDIAPWRKRH